MTWLDDAANAVSDAASSVAQTVENTAQAVEQKAADIVQTVENKAADAVQTVENKASEAVDAVEQKASQAAGAAQGAWSSFKEKASEAVDTVEQKASEAVDAVEQKAKDVVDEGEKAVDTVEEKAKGLVDAAEDKAKDAVDTVEKKARDLIDEGGKAVDAIEKKAKDAGEAAVKWVHSIEGPIARILSPKAGTDSIITDIFGGDEDADPDLVPVRIDTFSFSAPKDSKNADGKYFKQTPITLQWHVVAPRNKGESENEPVNVAVEMVQPHWYHDSRTPLVAPCSELVGSVTAKVEADCEFRLVAFCTNHIKYKSEKGKAEKSIEIPVDESDEYEGPEAEIKFGQSYGFDWERPIPGGRYIEAKLKASISVAFEAGYTPPAAPGAKEKLAHFIVDKEVAGGKLSVLKIEGTAGEGGLKVAAGAERDKHGDTEIVFGLEYEVTLATGVAIKVEFNALKISNKKKTGETEFEVFGGGASAEFSGTLAGFEYGGASLEGTFTASVGVEATPNWEAIAETLLTDAAIDVAITAGFVLAGIATIANYAMAIADVAEMNALGGRVKEFADGYYRGYLSGLSGNVDYTEVPGGELGPDAYHKGNGPGMGQRAAAVQKLQGDGKKTIEEATAAFDDWWNANRTSLVGQAQSTALSAAQAAVWDAFASKHVSSNFTECAMRNRAYGEIFGQSPEVARDKQPIPRWLKYCTEDTSEDIKHGIF